MKSLDEMADSFANDIDRPGTFQFDNARGCFREGFLAAIEAASEWAKTKPGAPLHAFQRNGDRTGHYLLAYLKSLSEPKVKP